MPDEAARLGSELMRMLPFQTAVRDSSTVTNQNTVSPGTASARRRRGMAVSQCEPTAASALFQNASSRFKHSSQDIALEFHGGALNREL